MVVNGLVVGTSRRYHLAKRRWALTQECQKVAPEALEVLVDIMRDHQAKDSDRISATKVIFEYGYGKAPQVVIGDQERPIRIDLNRFDKVTLEAMESALKQLVSAQSYEDADIVDAEVVDDKAVVRK